MHARLIRKARWQAPGITIPHRVRGGNTNPAAVCTPVLRVAIVVGIIDADLRSSLLPWALDASDAAAEDGLGAEAYLLD